MKLEFGSTDYNPHPFRLILAALIVWSRFTIRYMSSFTHLHAHSYYSLLEGLPSPEELVQAAVSQGMHAVAMTDHSSLTGVIEFYSDCQAANIQPIIGLQVTVTSPLESQPLVGDLVLIAQNLAGWRSLCRISSAVQSDPTGNPDKILPFTRLAQETEGLLCLTAGNQGCLDQLVSMNQAETALRYLAHLKELFPDHLYVELQRRTPLEINLSRQIASIASQLDTPIAAANQVYYLREDQAEMQKLVTAIRYNKSINTLPGSATPPPGSHFTSAEEMSDAVMENIIGCEIFVGVAAVADYRPVSSTDQKIKKTAETLTLELIRNPDILAMVAALDKPPFTVGFAAETENLIEYAKE